MLPVFTYFPILFPATSHPSIPIENNLSVQSYPVYPLFRAEDSQGPQEQGESTRRGSLDVGVFVLTETEGKNKVPSLYSCDILVFQHKPSALILSLCCSVGNGLSL